MAGRGKKLNGKLRNGISDIFNLNEKKNMLIKQDYYIAALVGFLVGVFAVPTLVNLGYHNRVILMALPIAVPFLWAFGVWLGGFLARWIPFFAQFGKFVAVGFLNYMIDSGILNLLSVATGITAGVNVGWINMPGFLVAVINSYFWNNVWVFKSGARHNELQDFTKFFLVTLIGLGINSGLLVIFTSQIGHYIQGWLPLVDKRQILNIAKVAATVLSLIWNFIGYKFFVFRGTDKVN